MTMCYMTILSTTSNDDLSVHNNELVKFSEQMPGVPEEKYLQFPRQWFIGSKDACSCSFRHLYVTSVELGFGAPEDWYPEESEDIEATRQVIAVTRGLIEKGEQVDCVDAWMNDAADADPLAGDLVVNLSEVDDLAFRFFESHRFTFVGTV
ncbi:hypothetical protein AAKU55_005411 [Oxalobacteraceae bacterium GrIS 1.11]